VEGRLSEKNQAEIDRAWEFANKSLAKDLSLQEIITHLSGTSAPATPAQVHASTIVMGGPPTESLDDEIQAPEIVPFTVIPRRRKINMG